MEVIDLKYGKGIKVESFGNPQLKLYGLGAYWAFEMAYEIKTVKMTIVQPRLDHISSAEETIMDLIQWGLDIVRPRAAQAYLGKGEKKAGDWCKWCKVKAMCKTLAEKNIELAQYEFKDPHLLTDSEILEVYSQIAMLTDWVESVSNYLLDQALKGKDWPGYKLVEGRSMRKWLDEDKVAKVLSEKFKDPAAYMVSKLAGIPTIEKLIGKKDFIPTLGELVIIPPGKPTLVPASDKRIAINSLDQAKKDFS